MFLRRNRMVLNHASTAHNSRITVCSGHTVPRETGLVRVEALCDALVPEA